MSRYTWDAEDYEAHSQAQEQWAKELIEMPKDMQHAGKSGLEGWIRTTWLPYTQRVPDGIRHRFIEAISSRNLEQVPLDAEGRAHVAMVRLEVDAERIK